jgi:hypothetical protein
MPATVGTTAMTVNNAAMLAPRIRLREDVLTISDR